jgi:membrane protease YdiL (CAAX protease family)
MPVDQALCEVCTATDLKKRHGDKRQAYSKHAIMDVIGLYLAFLLTLVPIAVLAWSGNSENGSFANIEVVQSILASVLVIVWSLVRWRSIAPVVFRPFKINWLPIAVGISALTFGLGTLFLYVLKTVLGVPEIYVTESFVDANYSLTAIILIICVQPAIIEELAFRGIIFNGLSSFLTIRDTVIVSSLMFMVLHLSAFGLPQLVLGLILAWMLIKSGSIVPGMILHFCHNLWCVLNEMYWS